MKGSKRILWAFFCAFLLGYQVPISGALAAEALPEGMVERSILLDSRIMARDLRIQKRGDEYVVSATVPSLLSKDLLEETLRSLVGVRYSVSGVKIDPPPVPDEEIRNAIAVSIPSHCLVEIKDFQVDVRNGKVTLRGIGSSTHHRWMAGYIARGTRGVKSVENDIRVVGERSSDKAIRENAVMLLKSHLKNGSIRDLDVAVRDGRVTVKGVVDTYSDMKRVDEILSNMPGVASLDNEVRPKPFPALRGRNR